MPAVAVHFNACWCSMRRDNWSRRERMIIIITYRKHFLSIWTSGKIPIGARKNSDPKLCVWVCMYTAHIRTFEDVPMYIIWIHKTERHRRCSCYLQLLIGNAPRTWLRKSYKNRTHSFSSPLISSRMSNAYKKGDEWTLKKRKKHTCRTRSSLVCMHVVRTYVVRPGRWQDFCITYLSSNTSTIRQTRKKLPAT